MRIFCDKTILEVDATENGYFLILVMFTIVKEKVCKNSIT